MSQNPREPAMRATRNIHAFCLRSSGNNYFGDIPLGIWVSMLRFEQEHSKPHGRIATRSVRIKPDVARLLNPEQVSDDFFERTCKDENALTEGAGAEQLKAVLKALCGHADPNQRRPVRYSLNAARDIRLIRNYLWREGHSWQQTAGTQSPLKTIDVRHALMAISGISRTMGFKYTLPKELWDYDLDPRELGAQELCRLYGVQAPNEGSDSAALLRLVIAARGAEYSPVDLKTPGPETGALQALQALGAVLDHLEGVAGIQAGKDEVGDAKNRARSLITPVRNPVEITPSHIGLLLCKGVWFPVIQPVIGNLEHGSERYLYSLPDGQPLPRQVNMSAPLARLDMLASKKGWDAAADERLRRICGREGEPISFVSLREAFQQTSDRWPPPEPQSPPAPTPSSNTWTRIHEGYPDAKQYASAGKAVHAINRGDAERASSALTELAEQAAGAPDGSRAGVQILLDNIRLTASRADLLNDGREAWLRQMALLPDPEAWPSDSPLAAETLPVILFGDGPVAKHNRIAVASRSALGISVSNAARAAVSASPSSAQAVETVT